MDALGDHRDCLVLIGAQAAYLHAPDDDLAVAPTTTDADLGLDPDLLAGCLLDKGVMTIGGLEDGDDRAFSIAVAGPAALVVAKTHKIAGRRDESRGRLRDKDALDVYRLLRAVDPQAFAVGFARLRETQLAAYAAAHPPDAEGVYHVRVVRLEVEATVASVPVR